MARPPLSTDALVATSRSLLVEGGPDAIVVREVARRLGVTAPRSTGTSAAGTTCSAC
jgi:AcrR family transcriptional regulator